MAVNCESLADVINYKSLTDTIRTRDVRSWVVADSGMDPAPRLPTTTTYILEVSTTLVVTQIISHLLYCLAHKPTIVPLDAAASGDPSCPSGAWGEQASGTPPFVIVHPEKGD